MLFLQALPEDKKPLSAELFWLTFRLHAGLPLSPRDSHAGVDSSTGKSDTVGQLFKGGDNQLHDHREMALLVLCSFAEGGFTRPRSKKSRVRERCEYFLIPLVSEVRAFMYNYWIVDVCARLFKVMIFYTDYMLVPTLSTPVMCSSGQHDGKGTTSRAVVMNPTRLMAARKMMGDRVAQNAAEEFQEGGTMSGSCTALALRNPNLFTSRGA